jgi:hypothetical protein
VGVKSFAIEDQIISTQQKVNKEVSNDREDQATTTDIEESNQ